MLDCLDQLKLCILCFSDNSLIEFDCVVVGDLIDACNVMGLVECCNVYGGSLVGGVSDCRGFEPVLGVTLEAERVDHEAGAVDHIPSLDKASCVGLDVGLLDGVAHDALLLLMAQVYTT